MSLLDTFSIVTFSWPWEAFGRVWLVFEACSASLWTLSTSSIRPSAACLDPADTHLPLKLQIQSNIPGLAPVKRSQNNPLRPKGATFCRQNVSFIAENWERLVTHKWSSCLRLKMSEMPVLLFWHLSTAGLKAGDTLSSAVFFQFPENALSFRQLASETDNWQVLWIWPYFW